MKKIFLLLLIMTAYKNNGLSQPNLKENPLLIFMQNNFDTTIVFFPFSNRSYGANYYIFAKKQSRFFLFTYINPYQQLERYPDSLIHNFISKQIKFEFGLPDINEYFLPKKCNDSFKKSAWNEIYINNIWNLKNANDSEPCISKDGSTHAVMDAGEEYFYLITKGKNKQIYFYSPEFFEEHCPGNLDRINAIKITAIFNTLFKFEY